MCTSLATTSQALFAYDFAEKSANLLFRSFSWKSDVATTALIFELFRFLAHIFRVLLPVLFGQFLTLGYHLTQRTVLVSDFYL